MNKRRTNTSEVRAEQAANAPRYEAIYLGIDQDKKFNTITRIIDGSSPQPAQKFTWDQLWPFMAKQLTLGQKVYAVYEAGAFGFGPARKLLAMGVDCSVVHPEKLDPRHKRVQTDKLDSLRLAEKLQLYVRGNKKAMQVVRIPTEQEEQQRLESRHRRALCKQLHRQQARGRGLLLSQGIFEAQQWWKAARWESLKERLCGQLRQALEDGREQIELIEKQLGRVEKQLESAAPKELPRGFGRLTFVLLIRELCNCKRFENRRGVAGFTGLCGAVSSSGEYHAELSINKAGSPYLRTLLVELAWRMIYWQPQYRGLKVWKQAVAGGAGRRRRKVAVVAVARQLAVDIWRWQTGRVTPEELGWKMSATT